MDRMTKNVLEYEIEPQPHPWVVNFWMPLAFLLCLTIVGIPFGVGLIAALMPKVQEHSAWKEAKKREEQ